MHAKRLLKNWLPHFRRSLGYLRSHRKPMIMGLIAALGVSLFYTFSISSIIPMLKVLLSQNESVVTWLHRVETERRMGVSLGSDKPDDPDGLLVLYVRPDSRSAGALHDGDRIVAMDGQRMSSYEIMRQIAETRERKILGASIDTYQHAQIQADLSLRSYHWWSDVVRKLTAILPTGRDAQSRLSLLAIVMLSLVVVAILGGVCRVLNEGLVAAAVQQGMHDLRSRLADHVLRLPMSWHSSHPPGDTLGRFATDISKVEVGQSTLFGKMFREPLKAIGVLALTLAIDWHLLLVALLGLPIGAIVIRYFGGLVKRAQRRASQSWGRLLDHLGEKLAGIRVVKAYNMQEPESRRFEHEGRTLTRAQTHIELADAATNPALETLAMMGVAAFVLYGGSRVFNHELDPNLFFAAVVCLGGIFDPVRKLGNVNNRLQQADASALRLFELLDLPAEEANRATQQRSLPKLQHDIEFRDVSFAYPAAPERPVLDDIGLRIRHGQVVALVGANGSGKTTLMSLLMRFFEPTRGQILMDGHDIADFSIESLRAQIGLVTQDAVVFSDTVRANISYGANGVQMDEVCRAAERAHADEFIRELRVERSGEELRSYDVPITARTLSGGQKQRLALARAILRDPSILILDEATSQIDSESERNIQAAIEDVTRDRTTFIIAHRFSTIARADVTVVLDQGRIVAHGRHSELMETCPFYVTLCETQFALGVT